MEVEVSPPIAEICGLKVLYQDEYLIVIDKPSSLRSVPSFQAPDAEIDESKKRKRQQRFSDVLGSLANGDPLDIGPNIRPYIDKLHNERANVVGF